MYFIATVITSNCIWLTISSANIFISDKAIFDNKGYIWQQNYNSELIHAKLCEIMFVYKLFYRADGYCNICSWVTNYYQYIGTKYIKTVITKH